MDGQKINVKIDGRSYIYVVNSEEKEIAIRKAAESVNEKIKQLSSTYKERGPLDIVTIAALNEGIERFMNSSKSTSDIEGYEKLSADLANYVESLK